MNPVTRPAAPAPAWAGVFSRLLRPVFLPFRTMASRRNSWDDARAELARLTPERLARLGPAAADRESRLAARYWWHLQQDDPRSEPLELRAVVAHLALQAGRPEEALHEHARLARAYDTLRERLGSEQRMAVARRLAGLRADLAQWRHGRGNHEEAAALAEAALRLRVLPPEKQEEMILILVDAESDDPPAWQAYLDFLHDRGHRALPPALTGLLQQQESPALLRRIHLAAPWLDWPLVRLAQYDVDGSSWDAARRKLELVRSHGEATPRVPFLLGQVAYFQERYDEAERHFAAALEGGVDVAGVYEFMGVAKANIGDFAAAQELIEKALAGAPDDPYLGLQRANILFCRDRIDEAEAAYRALLASGADDAHVLFGLGKVEEVRGNSGAARAYYERILARGEHVPARFSLAIIFTGDGDLASARDALARIHDLDPSHLPTRAELGILSVQMGLEGFTRQSATGSDRDLPPTANRDLPAAVAVRQGIRHLSACEAAAYPDDRVAYWLGRAFAATGDFDACLQRWEPLLARRSSDALQLQVDTILFRSALACLEAQDANESLERLARTSTSGAETLPVEALLDRVDLLLAQGAVNVGRHEKAIRHIDAVLSRDPSHPRALLLHCVLCAESGELRRDELQQTLDATREGAEQELLRLIAWTLDRERVGAEPLWEIVARERLPERLTEDPELQLLHALGTAIRARRDGTAVTEDDVLSLFELTARAHPHASVAVDELAWFLAHLALATGPSPNVLGQLSAAGAPPLLAKAFALVQLGTRNFEEGLRLSESISREENKRLASYLSDVFCHCAYKELQRAAREPIRLRRAHELFEKAAELC